MMIPQFAESINAVGIAQRFVRDAVSHFVQITANNMNEKHSANLRLLEDE